MWSRASPVGRVDRVTRAGCTEAATGESGTGLTFQAAGCLL
jgi:hypothetical protein